MTLLEWGAALEDRQIDKRRVAETTLPNGRWVSTVWMGLDHNFVEKWMQENPSDEQDSLDDRR